MDSTLPHIEEKLMDFIEKGYPFSNIRWPVIGGMRDNSPYIQGYSDTIRRWNEQWEFPRLISSTNAIFYKDFVNEVPKNLPVWRGELRVRIIPPEQLRPQLRLPFTVTTSPV